MGQFLNSARLPVTQEVGGGDLVPVFVQNSGITMAAAMSTIAAYIQTLLVPSNYAQQVNVVPNDGGSIPAQATSNNLWYLLQPAGTLVTLSLALPANGVAIDGQTVAISTSNTITSLTVTASGSTVIDPISVCSAQAPYTCKYAKTLNAWFRI